MQQQAEELVGSFTQSKTTMPNPLELFGKIIISSEPQVTQETETYYTPLERIQEIVDERNTAGKITQGKNKCRC